MLVRVGRLRARQAQQSYVTNLLQSTEDLSAAYWTKSSTVSIGTDAAVAPDGTTSMDGLIEDGTTGIRIVSRTPYSFTSGLDYCFSVYAKAGTRNFAALLLPAAAFTSATAVQATLSTGALSLTGAVVSSGVENIGNGIYRFWVGARCTATIASVLELRPRAVSNVSSYAGVNGQTAIYAWGFQLNVGLHPGVYKRVA